MKTIATSLRRIFLLAVVALIPARTLSAQEKLNLLLSNDDGYMSQGIQALVRAFQPIANIVVAAPAVQQSGAGHGITYREPLMVRTIHESDTLTWYAITARPATAVRLALDQLVHTTPDLVISGINTDANVASGTWVSGTVAAAREGAFDGITSIATALEGGGTDGPDQEYDAAARIIRSIVEQLRDAGQLGSGMLLNVNIPRNPTAGVRGVALVRAAARSGVQGYVRRLRPGGSTYFWDTWTPKTDDASGTDIHALAQRWVTVTPLLLNQTATSQMEAIRFLADEQ